MTHDCGIDQVGVARVNAHSRNMMTVSQANGFPGLAGVGGFPHAAPMRDIATHCYFTTADIDDVWVPFTDSDSANGAAKITIGNVFPIGTPIPRFPDSTAGGAHIVEVVLAGYASHSSRAAAAEWTD